MFEPHKSKEKETERNQIESVLNDKQEYKFVGSINKKSGLKLFSFNPENGDIKEVILIQKASLTLDGGIKIENKTDFDPKLRYIQALNKKNAMRKFSKGLNEFS